VYLDKLNKLKELIESNRHYIIYQASYEVGDSGSYESYFEVSDIEDLYCPHELGTEPNGAVFNKDELGFNLTEDELHKYGLELGEAIYEDGDKYIVMDNI